MSALEKNRYLVEVHQVVVHHFSEEELKMLCFRLNVDYDDLPAAGKANKARELVLLLARDNQISRLKEAVGRERPAVSWPDGLQESWPEPWAAFTMKQPSPPTWRWWPGV